MVCYSFYPIDAKIVYFDLAEEEILFLNLLLAYVITPLHPESRLIWHAIVNKCAPTPA